MNMIAILSFCLACVNHRPGMRIKSEQVESTSHAVLLHSKKVIRGRQAKSLSKLLLASTPTLGWHVPYARKSSGGAIITKSLRHPQGVSMLASNGPLRVLCLQPKGGTAEKFLARLQSIRQAAGDGLEWDAIDAPQVLDGPEELQWWVNPPGERSYTATAYEGDDIAIEKVEDAWAKRGPYDVILGFSQGAMLAAIVIARGALGLGDVRPRGAVLMGAATPKPYEDLMSKFKECAEEPLSLHCLSREDTINPSEMGEWIASCFGSNAQIFWHTSGHVTPGDKGEKDSGAITAVADFLTGMASR